MSVQVKGWTILVALDNGTITKLYDLPNFVTAAVNEHISLLEGVGTFQKNEEESI
jgi:hypothetical protein